MSNPHDGTPPPEAGINLQSSGSKAGDTRSIAASFALARAIRASATSLAARAGPSWDEDKHSAGEEHPSWAEGVVMDSDGPEASRLSSTTSPCLSSKTPPGLSSNMPQDSVFEYAKLTSQDAEKKPSKMLFGMAKLLSSLSSISTAEGGEGEAREEEASLASTTTYDDLADDKATPLLAADRAARAAPAAGRSARSRFWCDVCSARRALVVANVLFLVVFFFDSVAVGRSPGRGAAAGQNVTAMVIHHFVLLLLYAAFRWNVRVILAWLLWEAAVFLFACMGVAEWWAAVARADELRGTEPGTLAFAITALLLELACLYAQVAFVHERMQGSVAPGARGKVLGKEDQEHEQADEGAMVEIVV